MMKSSRREFLALSLAAALDAYIDPRGMLAEPSAPESDYFARLKELAPGSIQPKGWLGLYLNKQAAALALSLPDVSWPFTAGYWEGEEQAESWWPWEQTAYWVDGATRCALATGDTELLQRAMERIRYTLDHPQGTFLGPKAIEEPTESYHRWPHAIFFRALTALSDAGSLPNIPQILSSFYLSDSAQYDLPARNVVNVETMLWCYGKTGDPKMLAFAEKWWQGYVTGKPHDPADLNPAAVYGGGPINAHGVTYAEVSKLPAILHAYTGKPEYLRFALAAQQRIFDHHMLVDGVPSTTEYFRGTTSLNSHETCDITDHTWGWGYLLKATGDGVWADRIERACFNAGMGAIRKDWKGLQYFSCPNQVLSTLTSNHNVLKTGNYWMAYQPNPGRATACCGANVHRFFPNYALRMWFSRPGGGVAATLYGASSVRVRVGRARELVTIEQETAYPFEEQIQLTIRSARSVEFPLSLRIPGWCFAPQLRINQHAIKMPPVERGFITVKRRFHPGDVVTLILPMEVKPYHAPENGIAFERGPLVYSYAIDAKWSNLVIPKWTTTEYPAWEAVPAGPWNFGVTGQDPPIFTEYSVPDDPWLNPPLSLQIRSYKLKDWKLTGSTELGNAPLTPPLPGERSAATPATNLRLVPYGATELRLTIFPQVQLTDG